MKYIAITGSVVSGVGKGIVTSSIGALMKAHGFKVTAIKIDPYLNLDAGTFSPYEHGEVFVLNDGCEVDLDLGNYERYLDIDLKADNNITTGKINLKCIQRERHGDYLGKTVQIVPHLTDLIQEWIETTAGDQADICLIELGGTTGDIEGMPFIEALRRLRRKVKRENFCVCNVTRVLCIDGQFKTKPTQHAIKTSPLNPDLIVCRTSVPMPDRGPMQKIANSCDVEMNNVFNLHNLDTVYAVPNELQRQNVIKSISDVLKLDIQGDSPLTKWAQLCDVSRNAEIEIHVALVGKYTKQPDCYMSVIKALEHASYSLESKPKIIFIDSSLLETQDTQAWTALKSAHCLIVPGGFGVRGTEGMIAAIKWARENSVPFLGICLGFQMATVEYSRNVAILANAHSAELKPDTPEPVVIEMLEYQDPEKKMGGTMRLGLKKTNFVTTKSILRELYGDLDSVMERHRHRYEINPDFIEVLEEAGLRFVGKNEDGTRMEILELEQKQHPYFVAVQYHPEYLTRPFRPSPPYVGLMKAAKSRINKNT